MGHVVEEAAKKRGHDIVCIIDAENVEKFDTEEFRSADVAIEFSIPGAAVENYKQAFRQGVSVVSGTTGWLEREEEVKNECEKAGLAFLHSSNFSIGVNIFFALNEYLAKIMNHFGQYEVSMKEIHHIHKLDHPSGTAISLANGIIKNLSRKTGWKEHADSTDYIDIECSREGEVPGTHIVGYISEEDAIKIEHEAFSRKGFALGAVIAAEWLQGKKGCFTMKDVMNFDKL